MRRLSDIALNRTPPTLDPSASVLEASRLMREQGVGSVLVVDERAALVGIFTGRDAVHRVLAAGKSPAQTPLAAVMTADPVVMCPEQSALEALRLMWDGGFRHVPVIDAGRLVGVVSRGDFDDGENERFAEERELWEHMR